MSSETASPVPALRRDFPWHIVVFLAPAVIVYTLVMILPLAETLRLSFFNRTPGGPEFFVGLENFDRLFFDERWSGAVLERALEQSLLLSDPHAGAEPDRRGAGRHAVDGQPAGPHLLPHRHLHADHAVGGDHRLRLEADLEPDLGRLQLRCWVPSA